MIKQVLVMKASCISTCEELQPCGHRQVYLATKAGKSAIQSTSARFMSTVESVVVVARK
jgi:hypothetical protein